MAGMGDSQQLWEAEQAALARGPNTPGAYDNKYGFDEYAMHEQVEFCNEVGGVMVGYAGHVPRARDKVGSCAIGNLPGTPDSINGAVGIDMETRQSSEVPGHMAEEEPQLAALATVVV